MISLYGKRYFETALRSLPDAEVSGRLVRVAVKACGVCGTDLHFLRERAEWTPLGHEISAEVVEVGGEVSRVRVGDRVIVEDVSMCGACRACKTGNSHLCRSGYTLDGQSGMSDSMVVHENMLNVYEGIEDGVACMVEPLAVAITCVEKLALPRYGSAIVFGMGAIGLFCAAYMKAMGARRVVMAARTRGTARNDCARDRALSMGVDDVVYLKEENWLSSAARGEAFDGAIVAAPPSACPKALSAVKYGGNVLACGITLGDDANATLDINDMVMNKKTLLTSLAEPAVNFPLAIDLIRDGKIDVARVITHRLALTEAETLKSLYAADAPAIKTIMVI